jgi:hypothetical protein
METVAMLVWRLPADGLIPLWSNGDISLAAWAEPDIATVPHKVAL